MAFKSFAVAVGNTNTDVIECPATQEGAAVLNISNVSGGASTYTLKLYKQALGTTVTIAAAVGIAANTSVKYPAPVSMEAGDKLVMTAPAAATIVASGTFTYSGATPAAVGLTGKGDWSSIATYDANDYVRYTDGNTYSSLQAGNTNHAPPSSPSWWMVLAEKGAQGDGDMSSANNLSDVANTAIARANLGLAIGVNVQAYDAQLSSLIRQASKSTDFTITANESGYDVVHPSTDNNPRTFTIPANSVLALPVGTLIMFSNAINVVTIAINSDTLRWVPSGATGPRSLAQYGQVVAKKHSPTEWWISGVGMA